MAIQIMFPRLENGCMAVQAMLSSGTIPAAAEIMDHLCYKAAAKHRGMPIDPAIGACLIMELDGTDDEDLARQTTVIREVADRFHPLTFQVATTPEEADALWSLRRGVSSAIMSLAPDRIGEDISVPRASFPEVVRRIMAIAQKYHLTFAVYGHAGDGNIHPSILCNLKDPDEEARVHAAVEEVFDAALACGGTLSGEHGIGITKRPYLSKALGDVGVATLRAIKVALDPKGILNPGKIW